MASSTPTPDPQPVNQPKQTESYHSSTTSLAHLLLYEARNFPQKFEKDLFTFECGEQTRSIHKAVLQVKLPNFIVENSRILVSAQVFDHVIEFIYTGKTPSISYNEIIDVYMAARQLRLDDLSIEIRRGFELRLPEYLEDPKFLQVCTEETSRNVTELIDGLCLESGTKLKLLRRLEASNLNQPLAEVLFQVPEPHSMLYLAESLDKECELRDAVTQCRVPCEINFSEIQKSNMVIFKDKLFATTSSANEIVIIDVASGRTEQRMARPEIQGVTVQNDEMYAWTKNEIFLIEFDKESGQYGLKPLVKSSNLGDVCVVKRTDDETIFARGNSETNEIAIIKDSVSEPRQTVVKNVFEYKLLGTYEDSVFVVSTLGNYYTNLSTSTTFPLDRNGNLRPKMCGGVVYTVSESLMDESNSSYKINFTRVNSQTQLRAHSEIVLQKHKFNSLWLIPSFGAAKAVNSATD